MRIAQMIHGIKSNVALYQTFILDIASRMDQNMENPIVAQSMERYLLCWKELVDQVKFVYSEKATKF